MELSDDEIKKLIDGDCLDYLTNLDTSQICKGDWYISQSIMDYVAREGILEPFKILFKKGLRGYSFDIWGECLSIHNAIYDDHTDIVKWLLETYPRLIDEKVYGWNLLHVASNDESISTMIYLIQKAPHFLTEGDNNCLTPLGSLIWQDKDKYGKVFSEYDRRNDPDGTEMIRILSSLL